MAPTNFTAVQSTEDPTNRILLAWDEVEDATYNIYRDGVAIMLNQPVLEQIDTVEYDTQYIYAVTAIVDTVESPQSTPVAVTAISPVVPFATLVQLELFWKDVPEADEPRAENLLVLASNRLRVIGDQVEVDVDAKVAASPAYASTVQWVVMEAVKRAMLTPTDQPPVSQWSQTAGPYSENYQYTNPSGDLWFKKTELQALGLYGNQSLDNLSTARTDVYSEYSS